MRPILWPSPKTPWYNRRTDRAERRTDAAALRGGPSLPILIIEVCSTLKELITPLSSLVSQVCRDILYIILKIGRAHV